MSEAPLGGLGGDRLATSGTGLASRESPSESARFGRSVRRYTLSSGAGDELAEAIRREGPDLAIVRLPLARLDLVHRLREVPGVEVILCDVLAVWRRELAGAAAEDFVPRCGLEVRRAGIEDIAVVDRLVLESFAGYRNHYHLNPRLPALDLAEAYREWTREFLSGPERVCLVGALGGAACAFSTMRIGDEGTEIVLNGVVPAFRRRGAYRDLLRSMLELSVRRRAPFCRISTQLDNVGVQRVWAREGFLPEGSEMTVHVNRVSPGVRDTADAR